MKTLILNRCLILSVLMLGTAFVAKEKKPFVSTKFQQEKVVYDGKTGFGQWYVCDKFKTTIYEKEKKVFAYINKSSFECFGLYFDPIDIHRSTHLNFMAEIETRLKEDSVALYISFFDVSKNTSNFRKLKVSLGKGNMKKISLPLDDLIIKELKLDFSKINSILFYVESKRENGFWGNVVLKQISFQ
jgi:hypothetical protein